MSTNTGTSTGETSDEGPDPGRRIISGDGERTYAGTSGLTHEEKYYLGGGAVIGLFAGNSLGGVLNLGFPGAVLGAVLGATIVYSAITAAPDDERVSEWASKWASFYLFRPQWTLSPPISTSETNGKTSETAVGGAQDKLPSVIRVSEDTTDLTGFERLWPKQGVIQRSDGAIEGWIQLHPKNMDLAMSGDWGDQWAIAYQFANNDQPRLVGNLTWYTTTVGFDGNRLVSELEDRLGDPDVKSTPAFRDLVQEYRTQRPEELSDVNEIRYYYKVEVSPSEVWSDIERNATPADRLAQAPFIGQIVQGIMSRRTDEPPEQFRQRMLNRLLNRMNTVEDEFLNIVAGWDTRRLSGLEAFALGADYWGGNLTETGTRTGTGTGTTLKSVPSEPLVDRKPRQRAASPTDTDLTTRPDSSSPGVVLGDRSQANGQEQESGSPHDGTNDVRNQADETDHRLRSIGSGVVTTAAATISNLQLGQLPLVDNLSPVAWTLIIGGLLAGLLEAYNRGIGPFGSSDLDVDSLRDDQTETQTTAKSDDLKLPDESGTPTSGRLGLNLSLPGSGSSDPASPPSGPSDPTTEASEMALAAGADDSSTVPSLKTLLTTEGRSGVARQRSVFAPDHVEWRPNGNPRNVRLGDEWVRVLYCEFPDYPPDAILERLFKETRVPYDVTFRTQPIPARNATAELVEEAEEIDADAELAQTESQAAYLHDRANEARETVKEVQGGEQAYRLSLFVTVRGDSEPELQDNVRRISGILRDTGDRYSGGTLVPKTDPPRHHLVLQSAAPVGGNVLDRSEIGTAKSIATFYSSPHKSTLLEETGVEFGVHRDTETPIMIDPFDRSQGYAMIVAGDQGSGKTYASQLNFKRSVERDSDRLGVIIDPKQDWTGIAAAVGARRVDVNSTNMNLLEIKPPTEGSVNERADEAVSAFFNEHITRVMSFFRNYFAVQETPLRERAVTLEKAIRTAHFEQGISPDNPDTFARRSPTVADDVYDILKRMQNNPTEYVTGLDKEAEKISNDAVWLSRQLTPFVDGHLSNLGHESEFDIRDEKAVYFDFNATGGSLSGMSAMLMEFLIGMVYRRAQEVDKEVVAYLDEAHLLIRNKATLSYLETIWRAHRHHDLSIRLITQTLSEFLTSDLSDTILSLTSIIQLHHLTEMDDGLAETMGFQRRQMRFVRDHATEGDEGKGYSEALLGVDGEWRTIRVDSLPGEHRAIKYDPRQQSLTNNPLNTSTHQSTTGHGDVNVDVDGHTPARTDLRRNNTHPTNTNPTTGPENDHVDPGPSSSPSPHQTPPPTSADSREAASHHYHSSPQNGHPDGDHPGQNNKTHSTDRVTSSHPAEPESHSESEPPSPTAPTDDAETHDNQGWDCDSSTSPAEHPSVSPSHDRVTDSGTDSPDHSDAEQGQGETD